MKNIRFILLYIVLLCCFLLGSCTKDISSISYGAGDAQIEVELFTFAVNGSTDSNANEEENIIKSAYVFIFNSEGVLENAGKTTVTTATANGEVIDNSKKLNAKWNVYEGNKDIYIVANPDTELAGRLVSLSTTNGFEKSTLEALITAESAFTGDVAAFTTKGMLMTGKVFAVAVSGSSITVPITVTRRHARIDFMLRKAKDLEGATVVVKGVNYKDQIRKTIVFPSTPTTATAQQENKTMNVTVAAQQPAASIWSGTVTDYTTITNFYSFEKAPDTKAVCLEMIVSINGTDKVLPVYICSTAVGSGNTGNDEDKPIAIEANTVYQVMGTLTRQSIDIALNILDWNDQDVSGDIYGADFKVSKSKVLIPIVDNVGGSESVDLEASENISFIEYEYNGNKGPASILPTGLTVSGVNTLNGSATTGSITLTSSSTSNATAPVYLWFKAGNIKKRIEVNCMMYTFTVTAPTASYAYTGGTQTYEVTSYSGSDTGIGWTTEFSTDGGTTWGAKPDWIPTFTESWANGGTPTISRYAELKKSASVTVHNNILKATSPVSGIYDLSTNGGTTTQNTANCYVVNAAGTYSLPLIYGNAIINGATNESAYRTNNSGNYILSNFIKHDGTPITSPYINGALTARLIWQDADGLVTEVRLITNDTGTSMLSFKVNQSTICQGNAVVGVTDGTNVLWSWHIWVTDYKLSDPPKMIISPKYGIYNFMPVNIGWCDDFTYPARSVKVRFTQNESSFQKTIDLNQSAGLEAGNSPYFQWGRKDPFVGATANYKNKTWYNDDNTTGTTDNPPSGSWTGNACISNGILNPLSMDSFSAMDALYLNLWDTDNTVLNPIYNYGNVVKTVYDPSPVGYRLPAMPAFFIFGTADTPVNYYGASFTVSGVTIFFPNLGQRSPGTPVFSVGYGGSCYCWSASPNGPGNGLLFICNSGGGGGETAGAIPRGYGMSVRCIQY